MINLSLPRIAKLLVPAAILSSAVSLTPLFLSYQMDIIVADIQKMRLRIDLAQDFVDAKRDMELGLRGYLLTSDPSLLESYFAARSGLLQSMQTQDLPTASLRQAYNENKSRIAEIDRAIASIDSAGVTKEIALKEVIRSKASLDSIKQAINEVATREQSQIDAKRADLSLLIVATRTALVAGLISNLSLLLLTYLIANRDIKRLQSGLIIYQDSTGTKKRIIS